MKSKRFDGGEFPPHAACEFKHTWEILSPEGKISFEKFLDSIDHECFENFKSCLDIE